MGFFVSTRAFLILLLSLFKVIRTLLFDSTMRLSAASATPVPFKWLREYVELLDKDLQLLKPSLFSEEYRKKLHSVFDIPEQLTLI